MMDKTTTRIQKKCFSPTDLSALETLYAESKLKGGLGLFIASRLLGKTALRTPKSGGQPVAAPNTTGDDGVREKVLKSHKITFRCTARQYQVIQNYYQQSKAKQLGDFFTRVLEKGKVERVEQRSLPAEQGDPEQGHDALPRAVAQPLRRGAHRDRPLVTVPARSRYCVLRARWSRTLALSAPGSHPFRGSL